MQDCEPKELRNNDQKRSLKGDRFFQASLIAILAGLVLTMLGTPNYYSVPPEPNTTANDVYSLGSFILLFGILLLLAALANYVSKRMSDQDFWWVIKTGPFPQTT